MPKHWMRRTRSLGGPWIDGDFAAKCLQLILVCCRAKFFVLYFEEPYYSPNKLGYWGGAWGKGVYLGFMIVWNMKQAEYTTGFTLR